MNKKLDEQRLREELAKDCFNIKEYEKNLTTNIFYLEKELHVYVDDDYPITKMWVQIEELQAHLEREKKEYDKNKRR